MRFTADSRAETRRRRQPLINRMRSAGVSMAGAFSTARARVGPATVLFAVLCAGGLIGPAVAGASLEPVLWGAQRFDVRDFEQPFTEVAAGAYHTVGLRNDGTVIAWGHSQSGQATIPPGLSGVVAIAAGGHHTLALMGDRTVTAWGDNFYGQATVPAGLNDVVAIAGGFYHTVALKGNGTVVAWGDNTYGQSTVPPGLTGVIAISCGVYHTVALKIDRTVVAWGSNAYGQTAVPGSLSGVTAIAAGYYHTLALKSNGTVAAWGRNDYGQSTVGGLNGVTAIAAGGFHTMALHDDGSVMGLGYNIDRQTVIPPGAKGASAIVAGGYHTVALKNDGSLLAWGRDSYGQATVPAGLASVTAIAAGSAHTVALKVDGKVVAWGDNTQGQTAVPAGLSGVTAIAAGGWHNLALKNNGTVVAWGQNLTGQASVPGGLAGIIAIAAGHSHSVALKNDGTVVAWGNNFNGQATVPEGLTGVIAIAAGVSDTIALKNDGTVVTWGANLFGWMTVPPDLTGVIAIAAGSSHMVALKDDGTVVAWGSDHFDHTAVPAGLTGVTAIAAGFTHTVALKDDGSVVTWGTNGYGQTAVPANMTEVTAIAAGHYHTVALKSDGTVVDWGKNDSGQTTTPSGFKVAAIAAGLWHMVLLKNDGTLVAWGSDFYGQTTMPVGLTNVTAIAAGGNHTAALKSDGMVVAWGLNDNGQTAAPGSLSGISAIAAGYAHTMALRGTGTVVAWGSNSSGQATVPGGLTGVTAIAAGGYHSVALKTDGTVVAWGNNAYGQTTVPAGLTGVVAIAAGRYHTVALTDGGTVFVWGNNSYGQGTVPFGLSGVTAIAAGDYHTMALKDDGTVAVWGYNGYGQRTVPAELTDVTAIAAGGYFSAALIPQRDLPIRVFAGADATAPEVANGQVTAVEFGSTSLGTSVTRSFTLQNISNEDVTLTSLGLPAGYEHAGGEFAAIVLAPGGTHTFQISFLANGVSGAATGNVTLVLGSSDDAFGFRLTGRAVVPASGSPDLGFGGPGSVTAAIGNLDDRGHSMAIQSDGKIVVAGHSFNGSNNDFAVARFNGDGSPDVTFGSGGKVTTAIGSGQDLGFSVAVQIDGKIVVAGYAFVGGNYDFALARYNEDGSLDLSFGQNGKVITPIGSSNDFASSVAVQGDGKIVVAGRSVQPGTGFDFALARYTTTGELDLAFGSGGKATADFDNSNDFGESMALQSDGKIVVAGFAYDGEALARFALARFTDDGSLDETFGLTGKVITRIDSDDYGRSVAISGGAIVVAGRSWNPSNHGFDFAIVRYTTAGVLDPSFGSGGILVTEIGSGIDYGEAVALQSNGKIVVAGHSSNGSNADFAIARYHGNGSLDLGFGIGGMMTVGIGAGDDFGRSVGIQTDGKVVVAGYSFNGSNYDFAIARVSGDFSIGVLTKAASEVTAISVTLNGTVNPGGVITTAWFQYGADISYGQETDVQSLGYGSSLLPVTAGLTGLVPAATYHYRIVAQNGETTTYGTDMTVTTASADIRIFAGEDEAAAELVDGQGEAVDFGPAPLGVPVARTFAVMNAGSAELTGLNIVIGGADAADFSVIAHPAQSVAPGAATAFTIAFAPSAVGEKTAALQLASNDPDEGLFDISLAGSGVGVPVVIASQPVSQIVAAGSAFLLNVESRGQPVLTHQWRKKGANIAGAVEAAYQVASASLSHGGAYSVQVKNAAGSAISNVAEVTVVDAAGKTIKLGTGAAVSFAIAAAGNRLSYEWLKDGVAVANSDRIRGATDRILTIKPIELGDEGIYRCRVAGPGGALDGGDNSLVTFAAGTYVAAIGRDGGQNGDLGDFGGRLDLTVQTGAGFTGKVRLGATSYAFRGALDAAMGVDATGNATIVRKGLPAVQMEFTLVDDLNALIGTVDDSGGDGLASFSGWRNVWHATGNPPIARLGRHVFGLDIDEELADDDEVPQGTGFGTVTVAKAGGASISGKLADGAILVSSAPMGPNGEVLIYTPLYANVPAQMIMATAVGLETKPRITGSALGSLQIAADSMHSLTGSLDWMKRAQMEATERNYRTGFGPLVLAARGGLYVPPAMEQIVMGLPDAAENAQVRFAGGGIDSAATNPDVTLRITKQNTFILPSAGTEENPAKLTLSMSAATGFFQGKFQLTDLPDGATKTANRTVTYQGMLVPANGSKDRGYGFFLLPELPAAPTETISNTKIRSGQVVLEPR